MSRVGIEELEVSRSRAVGICRNGVEAPLRGSDKTVSWGIWMAGSTGEPGKANGNAAPDRLSVSEMTLPTDEQHWVGIRGLPVRDVCTLEVDEAFAVRVYNFQSFQPIGAVFEASAQGKV
jgi:hypothetical protein